MIQQHIENWKWAVACKPRGTWPETITTDDLRVYRLWCNELNKAAISAKDKNYMVTVKGIDKPKGGGKSMYIRHDVHTLKIAYVPRPRQQAVTETSRAAYAKLNLGEMQRRVAEFIAEKTKDGDTITRNEVIAWSDISFQNVCGRTRELLDMKDGFYLNGQRCQIVIVDKRLDRLPNAENKNEALRLELWREEPPVTFEPVPVQASLF